MELTQPLTFEPLYMERVWGGRRLETLYGRRLPANARIGESWELVDREEAQSVVHDGPMRGHTLHELWTDHREEIFGRIGEAPRFPLLIKLLDAQERLSVQVHPPAEVAAELGGEPKTEMWYFANSSSGADIFAGLRRDVTRASFEAALDHGNVAEQIHRIEVHTDDAIFIPSGRVHAIGAGNVIVEVQQNSDTTYRVFDWDRLGLDGRSRTLHVEESIRSIDFGDLEPRLQVPEGDRVVSCEHFVVDRWQVDGRRPAGVPGEVGIFACLSGTISCQGMNFAPGDFFVVPAQREEWLLEGSDAAVVLQTTIPHWA